MGLSPTGPGRAGRSCHFVPGARRPVRSFVICHRVPEPQMTWFFQHLSALTPFEAYAWLTVSAPVAVLVLCPSLAAVAGQTGAVIGFAAGWIVGGVIVATWAIRYSKRPEAAQGPDHGVRRAGGFGARAWVLNTPFFPFTTNWSLRWS